MKKPTQEQLESMGCEELARVVVEQINAKPKVGRPRLDDKPRAGLSASIAADTSQLLSLWLLEMQITDTSSHVGRVLDALAQFGKDRKFLQTLR